MRESALAFPDLLQQVKDSYASLPARAQRVARWLFERPDDVALLSTREQARSLGVAPATLTRFAQHFGFAGYDALRGSSQRGLRARAAGFAPEARRMLARRKEVGGPALAEGVLAAIAANLAALGDATTLARCRRPRSCSRAGAASMCLAAVPVTRSRTIFTMWRPLAERPSFSSTGPAVSVSTRYAAQVPATSCSQFP